MDYQEIKQKIKNCRNILVGIVPSPEAQVQQITIALMYKFMDDMDKEAQEKHNAPPMFFAGDFAKYSWTKLLSPQIGNQERMNLYAEAIEKMNENSGIPQLFRDIFKGAFLPYRSPESLGLFLKEINGFTYDNSENLGYAFEHLLSIMGSQGDAGMFRTPRHIIDFIVAAIDPQKNEQICDPSCGSAGFLISAYNHIMKANTKKKKGDLIQPEEKKKLIKNFVGYDISPDMVRLSKVNLYLHGFPSPTIFEYDTLSSEEKWDENFDVMLANPPFMSPTGGIRPHKRFSVQANRSEVLFVDYILEHLRTNGRAGIIVPEGIIFQSANAYKALRKLLIEDGLLAVVSLPAGVFNPYAGVKTSILLFDNGLAKKTKEILFLKIQNDGYGLGAQRREIDKNDLPQALEIIKEYKAALKENKKIKLNEKQGKIAHLVAKEKIAESGDYNLSGDRYKIVLNQDNIKWPLVKLGDVVLDMKDGGTPSRRKSEYFGGDIYWCVVKDIKPEIFDTAEKITKIGLENSSAKVWPAGSIIISLGASIGHVGIAKVPTATKQGLSGIVVDKSKILPEFLVRILASKKEYIQSLATGVTIKEVRPSKLKELFIFPLPPVEVQKEIVEQIEVKQKAIEAAKAVIENLERERRYFGQEIRKIKDVDLVELGGVLEYEQPTKYIVKSVNYSDEYKTPVLTAGQTFILGYTNENDGIFSAEKLPVIIFDDFTTATKFVDFAFKVKSSAMKILHTKREKADTKFLFYAMQDIKFNHDTHKRYWISEYSKIKIPLPSLEIQKHLVAEAEKEEEIITANRRLIELMEQKITEVLSEI